MPGATLTLGCNQFTLNPSSGSGVSVTKVSDGNFKVGTTSTSISPLVVQSTTTPSQSLASHTVTFTSALGDVNVNTTRQASGTDRGDRVTFEKNVGNALVTAGTSASSTSSGDTVSFHGSAGAGTKVITGPGNDSIVFASSAVNAYTGTAGQNLVEAGAGSDSIRFSSSTKVGANVSIDFGAQSGTSDVDILFGGAKSTFQGAGIKIFNFDNNVDQIRIGSTTLKNQAQINSYFADSGQSIQIFT